MSAHRTRKRARPEVATPPDPVREMCDELAAIYRILPYAVERDRIYGGGEGIKRAKPGSSIPAARTNHGVLRCLDRVRSTVEVLAAQALAILNADGDYTEVYTSLRRMPDWYQSLLARSMPLAEEIRRDVESILWDARRASGIADPDQSYGAACPEHRERPVQLRIAGALRTLAPSLLAGPPRPEDVHADARGGGRLYREFTLDEDGRLVSGIPTDWLRPRHNLLLWESVAGEPPYRLTANKRVFCPRCRRSWSGFFEQKLLAAELAALGDDVRVEEAIA